MTKLEILLLLYIGFSIPTWVLTYKERKKLRAILENEKVLEYLPDLLKSSKDDPKSLLFFLALEPIFGIIEIYHLFSKSNEEYSKITAETYIKYLGIHLTQKEKDLIRKVLSWRF